MPTFKYKAKDKTGETFFGTMEAETPQAVAKKLRETGKFAINITQVKEGKKLSRLWKTLKERFLYPIYSGVGLKSLVIFYREFATLINSGMSLFRCLNSVKDQITNKKLKKICETTGRQVAAGDNLSQALAQYPYIFNRLQIGMIKAGETAGTLDINLRKIADYLEKEYKNKLKLITGLTYPLILLFAVILIPKIPILILQGPLAYLIAISPSFILIAALIGLVLIARLSILNLPVVRRVYDSIKWYFPIFFGKIFRQFSFARFASAWGTLNSAGVGLIESLETAAEASGNQIIEDTVNKIVVPEIKKGAKLSNAFRKTHLFPATLVNLLATGEESGRVDEMLNKLSEYFEAEGTAVVDRMIVIIPVVAYLIVAAVIAYVVISFWIGYYSPLLK